MTNYSKIGRPTRDALVSYMTKRHRTGPFLQAILTNNLKDSVFQADDTNIHALKELCMWLHWHAPTGSYGSPDAYLKWLSADTPVEVAPASDLAEGLRLLREAARSER